jgi:hypothetical protein
VYNFARSSWPGGNLVSPFVNIMLEHQFDDNTRTLTANLTQAPLLPMSAVPNFGTRNYGRAERRPDLANQPDVSATINPASTLDREEGSHWRISTGLNSRSCEGSRLDREKSGTTSRRGQGQSEGVAPDSARSP